MTENHTRDEIFSQPRVWADTLRRTDEARTLLAAPGERMLIMGCGTSAFMAHSMAVLREGRGLGQTDWAYASELPVDRTYDRVVALTRSGTTTEILEALDRFRGRARLGAICAVEGMPVDQLADDTLTLTEADERSVVQTRFPTTVLLLTRAALGEDVSSVVSAGEAALTAPLPDVADFDHYVYLGRSWTQGLAAEAALKVRESAQAWAESYPALDYRHGPIAVAGERTLVTLFGAEPPGLRHDIQGVGATVFASGLDPVLQLVQAQRLAMDLAILRGLNPDTPRHLTRSIVLDQSV